MFCWVWYRGTECVVWTFLIHFKKQLLINSGDNGQHRQFPKNVNLSCVCSLRLKALLLWKHHYWPVIEIILFFWLFSQYWKTVNVARGHAMWWIVNKVQEIRRKFLTKHWYVLGLLDDGFVPPDFLHLSSKRSKNRSLKGLTSRKNPSILLEI